MIIRCYGARGSIPVSGEEYLKYGGDTTCLELRGKDDKVIIVDAGTGIRRLGDRLIHENKLEYFMCFTHSHMDHIMGFPFFKPIYNENAAIHLMGCPTTQGNIRKLLSKSMEAPIFPVAFEVLKAKIDYEVECKLEFQIDSIEIHTINLNHPNGGIGYKFIENNKKFVFLTDNELRYKHRNGKTFEEYAKFSEEADLLIHDSVYSEKEYQDTRGWGHSTYLDALELAIKSKVKRFGLFHHEQGRKDSDLDDIVRECQKIIEGKNIKMECFALTQNHDLKV